MMLHASARRFSNQYLYRYSVLALLSAGICLTASLPLLGQKKDDKAAKAAAAAAAPVNTDARPYKIGPGDVLEVNVWKEPEASVLTAVVRPDGMISLPLIKEVKASGQTPTSLQDAIAQRLSKLIKDADVTVVVKLDSDPDALPIEHEQLHRKLVEELVGRGLNAEDLGEIVIEREAEKEPAAEKSAEPAADRQKQGAGAGR